MKDEILSMEDELPMWVVEINKILKEKRAKKDV